VLKKVGGLKKVLKTTKGGRKGIEGMVGRIKNNADGGKKNGE